MPSRLASCSALAVLLVLGSARVGAGEDERPPSTLDRALAALAKGRAFLVKQQAVSGGFGDPSSRIPPNAGYTAMAVTGLLAATPRSERKAESHVAAGLAFIASKQDESGAIVEDPRFVNYFTSVAVGAWASAKIPAFSTNQAKAAAWLAASQVAEDPSSPSYGAFGYSPGARSGARAADLSNTSMAASALASGDLPKDHVVWQRLQTYLKRVQNDSEVNDYTTTGEVDGQVVKVVSGDDGGAGYFPGGSTAGLERRADGTYAPRSYGSMSYALLSCLVFAGVPAEDPRVQRVVTWLSQHWTLERNPGFEHLDDGEKQGQQGWFYYVATAARALSAYEALTGQTLEIRDQQGRPHDWREEMIDTLLARQADDGSWRNEKAERWDEGSKVLATSFALQTLGYLTRQLP